MYDTGEILQDIYKLKIPNAILKIELRNYLNIVMKDLKQSKPENLSFIFTYLIQESHNFLNDNQ